MWLQFLYPNVFEADGASTKRGLHFKNGSYVAFVSFCPKEKNWNKIDTRFSILAVYLIWNIVGAKMPFQSSDQIFLVIGSASTDFLWRECCWFSDNLLVISIH